MSTAEQISWHAANWEFLLAAIAELRCTIQQEFASREDRTQADAAQLELGDATSRREQAAANMPGAPSLDVLCDLFGLSDFERDILLLCAGMELDAHLPAATTFGLALAALPGAHWSALSPERPLRYWRMVDIGSGSALTTSPLRIDERILHYLTGLNPLDDRLAGLAELLAPEGSLAASQQALAEQMSAAWAQIRSDGRPVLLQVIGPNLAARQALAAQACALNDLQLYRLPMRAIPTALPELRGLLRLWEREARLANRALLLELDGSTTHDPVQEEMALRLAESLDAPLILSAREQRSVPARVSLAFSLGNPDTGESLAQWEAALADAGINKDALSAERGDRADNERAPDLTTLAGQFVLTNQDIEATIRAAVAELGGTKATASPAPRRAANSKRLGWALWDAACRQARPRLSGLAERIETRATWEDLILPKAQKEILEQIAVHLRQRHTVYESWGFGDSMPRGLGIAVLFSGQSGTGKTMAAEVLAHSLHLNLYRIDLSQVVSKYIGETEKNLRQVFDAAEAGGAILFFDEADALFGKRSEVRDSHDRYANIEISYLLQRMEAYRGLAILASNMEQAMDPAFVRRLRFVVRFPVPEPAERAEIWRRIFPKPTPRRGLDYDKLAQLNITGGSIRNIALHAAFVAAEQEQKLQMAHILQAARGEYARLERTLTAGEIRGWL